MATNEEILASAAKNAEYIIKLEQERDRLAAALEKIERMPSKETAPGEAAWDALNGNHTALLAHDREILQPVIELLEKWTVHYLIKGDEWKEACELLARLKARVEGK